MAQLLYAATNYFVTNLTTINGIDNSQTTGIILNDVSGIADLSKPSILAIDWVKNTDGTLDTTNLEYIEYTSIDSETKELQGVTRGVEGYAAKAHDFGAVIVFPISKSTINRLADLATAIADPTPQTVTITGGAGTVTTRPTGAHYVNFTASVSEATALASTMSSGDAYAIDVTFSGAYTVTFTGVTEEDGTTAFAYTGANGETKTLFIRRTGTRYIGLQ